MPSFDPPAADRIGPYRIGSLIAKSKAELWLFGLAAILGVVLVWVLS